MKLLSIAAFIAALLMTWQAADALPRHGSVAAPIVPQPANASYPLPLLNYASNGGCATNRYVNASTGSDSNDGTAQTTGGGHGPWATITHAETTLSGSNPATCINVASGTYASDIQTLCHGSTNTYAGWCSLRCAPNATTATAQPELYQLSNGAQGSLPACKLTNTAASDVQQGGIVATSNGSTGYNYVIVDGFEITDVTTKALTVTNASYSSPNVTLTISGIAVNSCSYVSGTGVMTLNLASASGIASTVQFTVSGLTGTGSIASANGTFTATSANNATALTYTIATGLTLTCASSSGTVYPTVLPRMCFTVAGLAGTGSINSANGYHCSIAGTGGASIVYPIAAGLTMGYTSGGTATYPDQNGNVICCSGAAVGSIGIGQGPSGYPYPAVHHIAIFNNYIHDMGGAGIQVEGADVFYVVGNWTQSNAWANPYQESGIGIGAAANASFTAGALDGQLGSYNSVAVHNLVANNIANNNGNPLAQTDGEGIIFDTNNGQSGACSSPSYSYATLDYGNITYYNGGKGNHIFRSSNIAVFNNTSYQNEQSTLAATYYEMDLFCGSNVWFKNNIGVAAVGSGVQASNRPTASTVSSLTLLNNTILWNKNILNVSGSPSACSGSQGLTNYSCYNGTDIIVATLPAAWASGTSYSGNTNNAFSAVGGSDGNVYTSLSQSANLGHNPVSDAPTPGTQGSWWQNDGLPSNLFTDPLITSPGGTAPVWTLQSSSPGVGTSGADVTGLGGYAVSTPNIGAY